jgi:hypothetical protein
MHETFDDKVSVLASFAPGPYNTMRVTPHIMKWRDRRWKLSTMGMYHPEKRGNKRVHIFSFSSGTVTFRLELDPETLQWTLKEAYYAT